MKRAKPHRLIGSDRVQVGAVAIVADLRKHVRQVTAVDHKLGIHESFKVEQVSYDVNGWENIQDIISKVYRIASIKNIYSQKNSNCHWDHTKSYKRFVPYLSLKVPYQYLKGTFVYLFAEIRF